MMRQDLITEKHFHDLGKLSFAFTAFWGFITSRSTSLYGMATSAGKALDAASTHCSWMKLTLVGVVFMFGPFFRIDGALGEGVHTNTSFMDAFPRMRVVLMTWSFRDELQVPVNPETMEPLPAHEQTGREAAMWR